MKKKKWNFGTGLIVMILVVSIGSICAFNRPRDIAQGKAKKVSNVQPSSRLSTKKVEKKISESSTEQSESTIQATQIEKSTASSETQTIKDLKAFNKQATSEEVYVKVPYGRSQNFERATTQKLEELEKHYTLKGMANLRDDYDGQTRSVIIFE